MFFHRTVIEHRYTLTHRLALLGVLIGGAVLRFWGLGSVGLFGDEETMAMPARSIMETGLPLLPSGTLYPRGLAELYLMAASAGLFGESEWAWRLPSALMGVLLLGIAFFLGKRFLPPLWNIVFVATMALLPQLITVSQMARMYVFLAAFIMLFALFVLRWSERGRVSDLACATVAFVAAIHFHTLAIFTVFFFFYPYFLKPSTKAFFQGAMGFGVSVVFFVLFRTWLYSQYPEVDNPFSGSEDGNAALPVVFGQPWLVLPALFLLAGLGWLLIRQRAGRNLVFDGGLLLTLLGFTACVLNHYHLGGLLAFAGFVLLLRAGAAARSILIACGLFGALLALQLATVYATGQYEGPRLLLRAFAGRPSPWPYLVLAQQLPIAFALYSLPFVYGVYQLTKGRSIAEHYLVFGLAVFPVLIGTGVFAWFIPSRYIFTALPFFALSLLAGLHGVWQAGLDHLSPKAPPKWVAAAAVLLVAAFVAPRELYTNVNVGYDDFPRAGYRGVDHKGAAEFVRELELEPGDIVMAEDVLQQTYYLGGVDYWLRSYGAGAYATLRDGVRVDRYTNTPQLGMVEELLPVLENPSRGAIVIIGSGETTLNPTFYIDERMQATIDGYRPETLYLGRDGRTRVSYIPAPLHP